MPGSCAAASPVGILGNMLSAMLFTVLLGQADPGIQIGEPVPDAALTNMKGETVRISDFRGKKLIVFNWASW